jgi:hypothetical protein
LWVRNFIGSLMYEEEEKDLNNDSQLLANRDKKLSHLY